MNRPRRPPPPANTRPAPRQPPAAQRGPGAPSQGRWDGGPAGDRSAAREKGHVTPSEPTEVVFGVRAGLAVFARRSNDVVRIAHTSAVADEIADVARWAETQRIRCEEVDDAALDEAADSSHHEGLAVWTRPRKWMRLADLATRLTERRGVAIALDRVRNPYNVGAILRSAAFFGVDAAIFGAQAPSPALSPLAVRVAEGGAEHLALSRTTDLADTLVRLREQGIRVIGTDAAAQRDALGFRFDRPSVLVVGHEREGLSPRVRAACDALVAIRGRGALDSLNVAAASSVLFAEATRSEKHLRS